MNGNTENDTDDLPPAPEVPDEAFLDVYYPEEALEEVVTEHQGKEAAEALKERLRRDKPEQ